MNQNTPIIDGPPPGNWQPIIDAWRALAAFARRLAASRSTRRPRKARPAAPAEASATEADVKAWEAVHGKPMLWAAPLFLAFAAVYAAPHVALFLSPEDPRTVINGWVGRLPAWAAPLSAITAGWLWLPWWVGLPALLMRLNAARITGRAIMDAVGWSLSALVVETLAWLYAGRKLLAGADIPQAERDGAWQLLAAEFAFLLVVATVLGPHTPRPRYFNQNMR